MRYHIEAYTDPHAQQARLAQDVRRGLMARRKSLPPKYFYDRAGSELFERITELPEYYLTRTESALLEENAAHLTGNFLPDEVVELGAGSSAKTRTLLDAVRATARRVRYVPIDVDRVTLETSAAHLLRDYPGLEIHAVVGDFERDLAHVPPPVGKRLTLFLGSTIGNLHPPDQRSFLAAVRVLLRSGEDRLLLGVDLVKDVKVLEAAYDDAPGVTRAFNRNILNVVNRGVDGDFDPDAFRHVAFYNEPASRIEMHLVAESPQTVRLERLGLTIPFAAGEGIWTESSYKFTRAGVEAMFGEVGLRLLEWHADPENYFGLALGGLH